MSKQNLSVPPGWKLVPIEPTVTMMTPAAENLCCEFGPHFVWQQRKFILAVYRELLAAAPPSPEHQVEQEPFAWATFDGEGSYDLRLYECNEDYRNQWLTSNPAPTYRNWVIPLYTAPQTAEQKPMTDAAKLVEALELALEYWRHRQQRYKNRRPKWVITAEDALAELERRNQQPERDRS